MTESTNVVPDDLAESDAERRLLEIIDAILADDDDDDQEFDDAC